MKFTLPDQLPKGVVELSRLRKQACLEMEVFKARHDAKQTFSQGDVARLEYLMDSRCKINAVDRSRMAHHEAGHAVLAVLMGGQVAAAEVFPEPVAGGDGWTRRGECRTVMDLVVEQQQHVIAAAGPAAEAVWEHGPHPTHDQISECLAGSRDAEVLRRWALTAGASHRASPTSEASKLVARCWPAVESLAVQIDERGEVGHKHVVKALGLSNDHAQHPFELSNIRAGMRAVPDPRGGARR